MGYDITTDKYRRELITEYCDKLIALLKEEVKVIDGRYYDMMCNKTVKRLAIVSGYFKEINRKDLTNVSATSRRECRGETLQRKD